MTDANTRQTHTISKTEHTPKSLTKVLGALENDHIITTTLVLNRFIEQKDLPSIINEITTVCNQNHLRVEPSYAHHLKIVGTHENYAKVFNLSLKKYQDDQHIYHASDIPLGIPANWKDKVEHVLGFNTNKIARPYVVHNIKHMDSGSSGSAAQPSSSTTFYPTQLASLYGFPTGLQGTGQKIGIIELGGGYVMSDITTYLSNLNITTTPTINAVSVDGGTNNPSDPSGASVEVILDVEVIVAIVPGSVINVYFAPNTDQGFYDAINTAINNGCSIISISWGGPENAWASQTLSTYNALFQTATTQNVTILAAAGDSGSSDGESGNNVDFPASSPYVLACGGTSLTSSNGSAISNEVVWNDNPTSSATGGGISTVFTEGSYQTSVSYPLNNRRGVPDVAGDADPNTGYVLYSQSQGGWIVVGGTSAVAPLWSGLLGRINQSIGRAVGFLHPTLYANQSVCRDITQGNNGAYSAGVGWDPCTGLGSPNGQALLNVVSGSNPPPSGNAPVAAFSGSPLTGTAPLTVTFSDSSSNTPTSWSWNFGDNTTSTLKNPSHTYNSTGVYTVSLIATNSNGSNTVTKTNYITVTGSGPVAAFVGTPTSGSAPLTVTFTNQSTGSPTSWNWNFGDGNTSTSQNPSHTYQGPGTFTVSLTVTNTNGSNTITKSNYISTASTTLPNANFSATPLSGSRPLVVSFNDLSSNSPTSWLWNFGDNTTSSIRNPSHTYGNAGIYTVSLTVGNSRGSTTLTKNSYINVSSPIPVVAFTASTTSGFKPLNVTFTDHSTNAPTFWTWNFGDGTISNVQNPTHRYVTSGTYNVSLLARNAYGTGSLVKTAYITVY